MSCTPCSRGGRRSSGFNLLGSHDTSRFRTVAGDADRQIAGAGLLFTMPGVPMVFAGDEVGLTGVDGDGARQPMPWDPARWDHAVLDAYRELGALRRASRALRHGGLRWVHAGADVLVFLREARDERVLVAGRAPRPRAGRTSAGLDGDGRSAAVRRGRGGRASRRHRRAAGRRRGRAGLGAVVTSELEVLERG